MISNRAPPRGRQEEGIDFRFPSPPRSTAKNVMRLLDKENLRLDMTKLGFEPESLKKFERQI